MKNTITTLFFITVLFLFAVCHKAAKDEHEYIDGPNVLDNNHAD